MILVSRLLEQKNWVKLNPSTQAGELGWAVNSIQSSVLCPLPLPVSSIVVNRKHCEVDVARDIQGFLDRVWTT